jgi:putative serine protease PepD
VEPGDADDADELAGFRAPPPADDRLWRHPSELVWAAPTPRGRFSWTLAVVSGLTGAVLTVGLVAATGMLAEDVDAGEPVVRQVARPALAALSSDAAPDDLLDIAREVSPAIVRLERAGSDGSLGSGVLFRSDGQLLTNAHLVDGVDGLRAVLADGRTLGAHLGGSDLTTDIAVVKLDGSGPFPTALLGTTDGMAVGQMAIAIGGPSEGSNLGGITAGVVSAMGRELSRDDDVLQVDMIQTDASVPGGASGGALLDRTGAVVGITTTVTDDDVASGVGFAIPVDVARAVAEDLLLFGRVRPVWVGLRGETVGAGAGVAVAALMDASPAAAAGLLVGDIVRRIDGHPVASMSAVRVVLRRRHPGDRVVVVYDRDGTRGSVELVLSERPAA